MRWIVIFLSILFFSSTLQANDSTTGIALESRDTYTRWYEYPGNYWEESFSFTGIKGDYNKYWRDLSSFSLYYGFSLGLYTGNYINSPGNQYGANAIRPSASLLGKINLVESINLLIQTEIAYLIALGSSDNAMHSDDFGVYVPSLDLGVGLEYRINTSDIKSIRLSYQVSIANLGVETDNFQKNDVSSEDWANSAVSFGVYF